MALGQAQTQFRFEIYRLHAAGRSQRAPQGRAGHNIVPSPQHPSRCCTCVVNPRGNLSNWGAHLRFEVLSNPRLRASEIFPARGRSLVDQQIRQSQPRDLDYFFEFMATVRVSIVLGGERFHGRLNRYSVLSDVPAKALRVNGAGPGYKVIRLRRLSRPQIEALQSSYPRPKSRDFLKRVVVVLPRWKLASGL